MRQRVNAVDAEKGFAILHPALGLGLLDRGFDCGGLRMSTPFSSIHHVTAPVHRPSVHVGIAQLFGDLFRHGALAGSGRSINCNLLDT